ncbi:hypothetical protein [Winogradskyella undariae]|uniref:hypothetical protein n=1 Tax=Winogradskyella undariae TaxID=1285465 RepID=UPI0015CBF2E4|nr:hypothetical protein [Winogradskyella undariae]
MKKYYFLISIFSLLFSFTSCSSDDSELPPNEILSSKIWVIKSKVISPSIVYYGQEITDISLFESEETKNYSFEFLADGTFYQYDSAGELLFENTWYLNADHTQLTFGEPIVYEYPVVGNMGFTTIDIISISSSKIVGVIDASFNEVDYEVTLTFI